MKKRPPERDNRTLSTIYHNILAAIFALILVSCIAIAYGAYANEKNQILKDTDIILNDLAREYSAITRNFSSVYLPIYENRDAYDTVYNYFYDTQKSGDLDPVERKKLADVLKQMMGRDTKAAWIAFFSPSRPDNYILYSSDSSLMEIDTTFPFIDELKSKTFQLELYGSKKIFAPSTTYNSFALGGGLSREMGEGAVIIGYQTGILDQIIQSAPVNNETRFTIITSEHIIYDSYGQYGRSASLGDGLDTKGMYTRSIFRAGNDYTVSYHLPWQGLFLKANRYTPTIFLAGFALALLARLFYFIFTTRILRQVKRIRVGLETLGNNRLDFRLSEDCNAGELNSIACSINQMATKLQSLIENEYVHSLKQKEAELAELQAKFDPHFLYNSLEIIRGRVYENGDAETADIIKKLSQLFRSLLSDKRFVTIQDELAFCNSYFSLFKTPQTDNIQVIYDVDSHLLMYGIVRNLLQPVIENYFVHGFDIGNPDNCITLRCKEQGRNMICIQIIDNGLGITDQRLEELALRMNDCPDETQRGYGLANLSKRIQLIYGEDCGLTIQKNDDRGVCITLVIKKMSCEQLESHFRSSI